MIKWNLFRPAKALSNSNLGYLTTYKLEDVYFFLGNQRIQEKIGELKTKATMGIRLEQFVQGKNVVGFYDKGPIYCLSLILEWFSDTQIMDYLFSKLYDYNEENYMKNSLWSSNRIKFINDLIKSIENRQSRQPNNSDLQNINELKKHLTYNYYYNDYHFFLISFYRKLRASRDEELKSKVNMTVLQDYPKKIERIKKSMIDLNVWIEQGLGNSILTALKKYCENTNQTGKYQVFFDKAANDNWRF